MRSIILLSSVVLMCVSTSSGIDLIVGTSYNSRLVFTQKVEYNSIPFKKRVKEVFFSDAGQQILKGIIARDLDKTEATAIITAGGVGFSYANIRLKSVRGGHLNYQIEFYV